MAVQTKDRSNIAVAATGGAPTIISATMFSRYVAIDEDPDNGVGVGLVYTLPEESFLTNHFLGPGEVLELGDKIAAAGGRGPAVGLPAQVIKGETIVATVLCKIISFTAATTKARVQEVS